MLARKSKSSRNTSKVKLAKQMRWISSAMQTFSGVVQGAELFLDFFYVFGFFWGFRAWCDLYGVLQACRMVSA